MVRGMSDAKHPLIAAEPAHAPPHLIGQRLEAEVAIGGGKGARDRVRRPMLLLRGKKTFNRLFEPSAQQVLVAVVGNQCGIALPRPTAAAAEVLCLRKPNRVSDGGSPRQSCRHMEPVNGIQKEKPPHPFVEVATFMTESLEGIAFGE